MVGFGEQDHNHAYLIFITAVTNKIFKISENSKLVVGSGEQDYNHASLIFIAAVTKKCKFGLKNCENSEFIFSEFMVESSEKV